MAEALALIGLVSNIFGFIEFGIALVSATQSLNDARKIPDVSELDTILDDIQLRHDRLRKHIKSSNVKLSDTDSNIFKMVQQCDNIAGQLRDLSTKLSRRPEARSRTADNVRVAFNFMVNKKEIHELSDRLMRMDRLIRGYMEKALQSDRDSNIMRKLDAVNRSYNDFEIKYDMKLDKIRKDVIAAITNRSGRDETELSTHGAQLASLQTKLVKLESELNICGERAKIIESLYFKEIKRRWSLIPAAEKKTNSWLFDRTQTTFSSWAESENVSAIYCISGLAGSGKSTLMKFVYDHPDTQRLLEKWAHPFALHKASYFFWNQGFERQKSQTGLLQSLLYQILRHNPELAQTANAASDRLHHEMWDFAELKSVFERIISTTEMNTRFCFFIDGLDEYDGEEEDIASLLLSINKSPHIKICASSRPRQIFDDRLWSQDFSLKMQDLTKEDMRLYVRNTLYESPRFRDLSVWKQAGETLMELIAERARGVWLWVFLVSRDLKYAVNRNEGLVKLRDIVDSFPQGLEEYFTRIISQIKPLFRDEMARIFLAALEGAQPLPLFAFSLLVEEVSDPNYATKATISSLDVAEVRKMEEDWRVRIQNRCGDLLVVEDGYHRTFLNCHVDFLHRTVRDFLQDCYLKNLKAELKPSLKFNPSLSLCKVMLYFLKKYPGTTYSGLKNGNSLNSIMTIVDQALYHAHEAERHADNADSALVAVLDQVDQVVSTIHARSPRGTFARMLPRGNHWTCERDSPRARGLDEYREGGNCNYIALTVQARLVAYVRAKLSANPARLKKPGRPLLDYALRPHRVTPLATPYHTQRDESNINVELVGLLLEAGADPNQPVFLNDDRSVWALFLISCAESITRKEVNEASRQAWNRASELMIQNGARSDCFNPADVAAGLGDAGELLGSIFGDDRADELIQKMKEKEIERRSESWTGWMLQSVSWR